MWQLSNNRSIIEVHSDRTSGILNMLELYEQAAYKRVKDELSVMESFSPKDHAELRCKRDHATRAS